MKKGLNSFQLKSITLAMMTGGMYLQQIIYLLNRELLQEGGTLSSGQVILYNLGYLVYLAAFPAATFLLVEAFKKTSDRSRLGKRLLLAALVAELPMDIATFGISDWKNWGLNQNFYFTLCIGFLVLMAVETLSKKYAPGTMTNTLLTLVVYLVAAFATMIGRTEQSSIGVLMVVTFYLFYGNKLFSLLSVVVLYMFFVRGTSGLAFLPALGGLLVWLYNGEQGKADKTTRLLFYAAFPIAYGILGIIAQML